MAAFRFGGGSISRHFGAASAFPNSLLFLFPARSVKAGLAMGKSFRNAVVELDSPMVVSSSELIAAGLAVLDLALSLSGECLFASIVGLASCVSSESSRAGRY